MLKFHSKVGPVAGIIEGTDVPNNHEAIADP